MSANTEHLGLNSKEEGNVDKRIYREAIKGRLEKVKRLGDKRLYEEVKGKVPRDIPRVMVGEEAVRVGLVDGVG